MNQDLYDYALIKSLYDQGHRYIDCFLPFVMPALSSDYFCTVAQLQSAIDKQLSMDFPLHILETLIKRGKKNGFVLQKEGSREYQLSTEGVLYLEKLENKRDAERRINALIEHMTAFFRDNGQDLRSDQANRLIASFVAGNRQLVLEFVNPNKSLAGVETFQRGPSAKLFIQYMQSVDESEPEHYKTLRDMILGSVMSTVVYAKDAAQTDDLANKKFRDCLIYLDTNFVFSVLQFDEPEFSQPAKELLKLLKDSGFEIRVLRSTVSELCRVVKSYRKELPRYPSDMKIDTIYSTLRRKGWKSSDVQEFIIGVESVLERSGIEIDWCIDIDLENHTLRNEDLRTSLMKYKPQQTVVGQTHDLSAIEAIEEIRQRKTRKLEDCKALFLTSDFKLFTFNLKEMRHKCEGTISEAIQDRLMANILWLKNPKLDLPLETVIAAHSRDLFINRRVWDRFYNVLQNLHRKKSVDDEMVSMLFYHNYIEDVLLGLEESELDTITPSFVLGHVQALAGEIDGRILSEVRTREESFIRQLDDVVKHEKQSSEDKWLKKVEEVKKIAHVLAACTARRMIKVTRVCTVLILLIPVVILLVQDKWDSLRDLSVIVSFIVAVVALAAGSINSLWEYVAEKLTARLFAKRIRLSALDKLTFGD